MNNYARAIAIENRNKKRLLEVNPYLTEDSGIYILTREENGIKYAYIGQATHLLTRLAQHLGDYKQHIDISLKKHKLISKDNPCGWNVTTTPARLENLDELEKKYIADYANAGFQLRNKTIGGQGKGKSGLDNNKPHKTYRDGIEQGYNKARKEIGELFKLHLKVAYRGNNEPTIYQMRAMQKFKDFLENEKDE